MFDSPCFLLTSEDLINYLDIDDSKLGDFNNYLDVFVFPTWLEGHGLPIVEAMACKKPVIVLHDARIPWEIEGRCIIVEELECVRK